MLESRSLLILPWEAKRRPILAEDDRRPVGFAALPVKSERDYLGALFGRGRAFEIHEAEDESLLATLRPFGIWKTSWNVLDADNRLVGRLQPTKPGRATRMLLISVPVAPARNHEALVGLEISADSRRFANLDREGRPFLEDLGTLEYRGSEQVLHFSEKLDLRPLQKLLLLAAALINRD